MTDWTATPPDGGTLLGWWTAASVRDFYGEGAPVTEWPSSGGAQTMSLFPTTAAAQPLMKRKLLANGQTVPAIAWDGFCGPMRAPGFVAPLGTTVYVVGDFWDNTIFTLDAKSTSPAGMVQGWSGRIQAATNGHGFWQVTTAAPTPKWTAVAGTQGAWANAPGALNCFAYPRAQVGANPYANVNLLFGGIIRKLKMTSKISTNSVVTPASGTVTHGGLWVMGWDQGTGAAYSLGDVHEVLVYSGTHTLADVQAIETWLQRRYGADAYVAVGGALLPDTSTGQRQISLGIKPHMAKLLGIGRLWGAVNPLAVAVGAHLARLLAALGYATLEIDNTPPDTGSGDTKPRPTIGQLWPRGSGRQ